MSVIHANIDYYMRLSNHIEAGFEQLAEAEYRLETGNFKSAKKNIQDAYQIVSRYTQSAIKLPVLMTMGRLSYILSDKVTFEFVLKQLERDIDCNRIPLVEKGIESSLLYLRSLMYDEVEIPSWMQHNRKQTDKSFYKYIIIGQILISQKNYEQLKSNAKILNNALSHHVFARIYAALFLTIAVVEEKGIMEAKVHYKELISLCEKDRIMGPILERHLLLKSLITQPHQFGFALQVKNTYEHLFYSEISFTKREYEVMSYIYKGYSIMKVAEILELEKTTVYTYLKRIYKKLNINKKDELIDYIKQKNK